MWTDNDVKKELYHDLKLSDPQSEMSNLAIKIARTIGGPNSGWPLHVFHSLARDQSSSYPP